MKVSYKSASITTIKNSAICLLLAFAAIGCHNQAAEHHKSTDSKTDTRSKTPYRETPDQQTVDNSVDFIDLTPLEIKNPASNNVFEKYGIDFNGNCYACDLANIVISKKHCSFVNVCDSAVIYESEIISSDFVGDSLILKSQGNEFTLIKIDEAPVYRFEIKGKGVDLKENKILLYFTDKKIIKKFKEHDCGDFQG